MADRIPSAILGFGKLTDSLLATYAQAVIDGLGSVAGLALYPTPPADVATITTALASFNSAMAAAVDLGRLNVAAKNSARLILENVLRADVNYVTQVARLSATDYATIRSNILISGFSASVIPAPVSSLPQPVIDEVISKGIGQLNIRLVAIPRARGYKVMYRKATETVFQVFFSTSSHWTLTGLQSATVYDVNFVAVGTRDTSVTESDIVQYTIL